MNEIEKDIRLTKSTFNGNDSKKKKSWLDMEIRYRRSRRLADLGAPSIIKQHELTWLYIMIHHFDLTLKEVKPKIFKRTTRRTRSIEKAGGKYTRLEAGETKGHILCFVSYLIKTQKIELQIY